MTYVISHIPRPQDKQRQAEHKLQHRAADRGAAKGFAGVQVRQNGATTEAPWPPSGLRHLSFSFFPTPVVFNRWYLGFQAAGLDTAVAEAPPQGMHRVCSGQLIKTCKYQGILKGS